MKPTQLAIGVLALVPLLSFGQEAMEKPHRGELFDTVLEYADESDALALQASREELGALRDDVKALKQDDSASDEDIQAAIATLRSQRQEFRDEVRTVIDENEDLQATLEEARADFAAQGREGRPPHRHGGPRPNRPAAPE